MKDFDTSGFIPYSEQLPSENQHIFIKYLFLGSERYTKGFYHTNAKEPCFCSYGSRVKNVIGWKPLN